MGRAIVVVGVGNFGAWWLLGLLKLGLKATIYACDPDKDALRKAQDRIKRCPEWLLRDSTVHFESTLERLPAAVDLVVVATNSDKRVEVSRVLRRMITSNCWILEKVLCQSVHDLVSLFGLFDTEFALVNHSRRAQPGTAIFGSLLRNRGIPDSIELVGGKWELASNLTHFMDMVCFWYNTEVVGFDVTGLNPEWHESSTRVGFFDVSGSCSVYFSGLPELRLDWFGDAESKWFVTFKDEVLSYDEVNGEIADCGNVIASAPLLNFSDLVPFFLRDTSTGLVPIVLPTLSEVYERNHYLLASLADHWRAYSGIESEVVPIS